MKTWMMVLLACMPACAQSAIGVGRGTGRVGSAAVPLTVIRTAKAVANSVSTVTVTLSASPSVGNLLVVFMGLGATATIPTTPSGTWAHVDGVASAHARMDVWTHRVVSGDGASYTFVSPVSSDRISLVVYEVAGANATFPVNQESVVSAGSLTTVTTPSVTPSVMGTLALSAVTTNAVPGSVSVSSGWTLDQSAMPSTHATFTASRTALTTDTTTAISDTFSFPAAVEAIGATVLIGP